MKQTPYWLRGKKAVRLSAADKVCLVLKIDAGSWKELLKREKKRWPEHIEDIERAKRIATFERKNHLKFRMNGGNLCDFYWVPFRRKTRQSKEQSGK